MKHYSLLAALLFFSFTHSLLAQVKLPAEGEFSLRYAHHITGRGDFFNGYGSKYADFANLNEKTHYNNARMRQPSLQIGLEGTLLFPITPYKWQLLAELQGSINYDRSNYALARTIASPLSSLLQKESLSYPDGHLIINSLIPQCAIGIRVQNRASLFYTSFAIGILCYIPLNSKWIYHTSTENILNHLPLISRFVQNARLEEHKQYETRSKGSTELLATLSLRMGYAPFYVGLQYATNIQIHALTFECGVMFYFSQNRIKESNKV